MVFFFTNPFLLSQSSRPSVFQCRLSEDIFKRFVLTLFWRNVIPVILESVKQAVGDFIICILVIYAFLMFNALRHSINKNQLINVKSID
jgi:hypothetical protein